METSLFTPSQAAVITGLSLKTVQKAIDERLVPARSLRKGKNKRRFLSEGALVCLHLDKAGLFLFPVATRKKLFGEILESPKKKWARPAANVTVDLESSRKAVARAVRLLKRAEAAVTESPDVLSGTPVFRGTRVPVHQIALEFAHGATIDEVLDSYPSITRAQAELAPMYAQAFPKMGRPPKQPWHGARPSSLIRFVASDATVD